MNTFAELAGQPPINWWHVIEQLEDGTIDPQGDEMQDYVEASGSWVTCAVGNQCAIIPRNLRECSDPSDDNDQPCVTDSPIDQTLFDLGMGFHEAVIDVSENPSPRGPWPQLQYMSDMLELIEERSTILIEVELQDRRAVLAGEQS